MKNSAFRRLQANFSFLKKYPGKFKFSENLTSKIEINTKPFESILYKPHEKYVMEIILNEPKKLNSLDIRMIKNLLRRVRQWQIDNKFTNASDSDMSDLEHSPIIPKVVIMSGAGKGFCAGGDIASLYHAKKKGGNDKIIKDFFRYEYLLDYYLTKMQPIQVAMWNGYVMGGGVGISIHAPIRIATDTTMFAMPETAIGFFPDVGGTYWLPHLFKENILGIYLGLTGDRIKGKDLARCGLATHYVPLDKFENLKADLIESTNENTNLKSLTDIVNKHSEIVFNSSSFSFPRMEEIKSVFKLESDSITDLVKIFERLENLSVNGSESEIGWAANTIKLLKNASPLSLVITLEQLKRGINIKTLEDAFNIEAQMVAAFVEETDSDFFEGVRALLIDKDNKPNWRYKSVQEIDFYKNVNKFFNRAEIINVDPNVGPESEIEKK